MAKFAVTVETIEKTWPHPNADRLELASVKGMAFQFGVPKDKYKVGDPVIYIPLDSVLPDPIIERLGARNFLAGKAKNRTKTVTLRGQISQGLVCPPEDLLDFTGIFRDEIEPGLDLTTQLNIVKYEPPEIFTTEGVLLPLPEGLGYYDIEGADRYPQIIDLLMDKRVQITEKMEGSNMTAFLREDGCKEVCQHGYLIGSFPEGDPRRDNPNTYVGAAQQGGLMKYLEEFYHERGTEHRGPQVGLRGELLGPGVQGNIYKLKTHEVRLFDTKIGNQYMNAAVFEARFPAERRVPVIASNVILREWLESRTIQEASNGMSLLNPQVRREGIVIKPMIEEYVDFGDGHTQRLIIKQRSPIYLAKEKDE